MVCLSVAACAYAPRRKSAWTPEKAKRVILKYERSLVVGFPVMGNITPASINVTDKCFDDFYLVGSSGSVEAPGTVYHFFRLRRVYFRDIETVRLKPRMPDAIAVPLMTLGCLGPNVFYHVTLTLRDDANVPRGEYDTKYPELVLRISPSAQWIGIVPLWLFNPVAYWSSTERFGAAILYMAERAKEGTQRQPQNPVAEENARHGPDR